MGAANDLADATIGQLLIPVSDLDRAIAFYRDTLGVQFLFSAPPRMAIFKTGQVRLLVGEPEPGSAPSRASMIYFRVPDIHAVVRTLQARGVAFDHDAHVVHRTANTELWLCDFSDPDGNPLCLMSEVTTGPASA